MIDGEFIMFYGMPSLNWLSFFSTILNLCLPLLNIKSKYHLIIMMTHEGKEQEGEAEEADEEGSGDGNGKAKATATKRLLYLIGCSTGFIVSKFFMHNLIISFVFSVNVRRITS